jgi:hypothetical protein
MLIEKLIKSLIKNRVLVLIFIGLIVISVGVSDYLVPKKIRK